MELQFPDTWDYNEATAEDTPLSEDSGGKRYCQRYVASRLRVKAETLTGSLDRKDKLKLNLHGTQTTMIGLFMTSETVREYVYIDDQYHVGLKRQQRPVFYLQVMHYGDTLCRTIKLQLHLHPGSALALSFVLRGLLQGTTVI